MGLWPINRAVFQDHHVLQSPFWKPSLQRHTIKDITQENVPVIESVPQQSQPGTSRALDETKTSTVQVNYSSILAVCVSILLSLSLIQI